MGILKNYNSAVKLTIADKGDKFKMFRRIVPPKFGKQIDKEELFSIHHKEAKTFVDDFNEKQERETGLKVTDIQLQEKCGYGAFSLVQKAFLTMEPIAKTDPKKQLDPAEKKIVVVVVKEVLEELRLLELEIMGKLSKRCDKLVQAIFITMRGDVRNGCHIYMEFFPKGSLMDVLSQKEQNNLDWQQIVKIILDVAIGLDFLHKENIVHRDIKLGNILIGSDYSAKLSDYGLAIKVEDCKNKITVNMAGSIKHCAPENFLWLRALGATAASDAAFDMYSLGVVIWQLVNKTTHIFVDDDFSLEYMAERRIDDFEIVRNIKQRNGITVSQLKQDELTPPRIFNFYQTIVDRACDIKASKRPSAEELVEYCSKLKVSI